ncbi:MAG: alkanesulfonate monooxygenase [Candidatus Rokuibacteriota bacterium]|nr:MAG: alkanesulfonate monooxygenase [Candidatus Rokubacteria bacterium]
MLSEPSVDLFSTCPASTSVAKDRYVQRVAEVARWSEQSGCKGILVYSDNSLLDPWLLAHIIIQNTTALCPLVAVQPVYMHPYAVAKQITSFAYLYGRRLYLNMVAGGFKNDLDALSDTTPHDKRYARLVEYTTIISRLLTGPAPLTYEGDFHSVAMLRLTPPLPEALVPGIFISGSSEAGLAAARTLGATAIKYPRAADAEERSPDDLLHLGVRVGIIARERDADAWAVAHSRFPEDRKGQLTHQLAMKVSDSSWHKQLSTVVVETERSPYWLVPFQNYKTMCPYLVGSYDRVAQELARYIALRYRTFILDVPFDREELDHINLAFARALETVGA